MNADPYNVLGVPETASSSEIKKAYRKLALQYHPDKLPSGSSERNKEESGARFTAISNAYQILGDEDARKKYHRNQKFNENDMNNFNFQNQSYQRPDFDFGFSDPFEVFSRVFGQEFGNRHFNHRMNGNTHMNQNVRRNFDDPFDDPFFRNESSAVGRFGNGFGGGFGGGFGSGFGMMDQMMQNMHNVQQNMGSNAGSGYYSSNMHNVQQNMGSNAGSGHYSSYSSSSTMGNRGSNQVSESVSTSTQIINGKRTTVTERVKVHPDGRIERSVEKQKGGGPSQRIQYNEGGSG